MKLKTFGGLLGQFSTVLAIILIWRGVWYVLDYLDELLFGGSRVVTVVGGTIAGLIILYLPDRDLKELGRL